MKTNTKYVLLALSLLFSTTANADLYYTDDPTPVFNFHNPLNDFDDYHDIRPIIEVGVATRHFSPTTKLHGKSFTYNNNNHVIGAGVNWDHLNVGLSTFSNSYNNRSILLNTDYNFLTIANSVDLSVGVGLVSGYKPYLKGIYLGNNMLMDFVTISTSADLIQFQQVKIIPKIRILGKDAVLFDVEFRL